MLSRHWRWFALAVIVVTAAVLRFLWLDRFPPGWHHDEALMGVMASEVYQGLQRPIFFPAYSGQEPLYIYLAAGMMALLGGSQDLLPLRLTSAALGLATVLVAYLMGKEMFGRRVGLLGAALLGTSFWHVMYSRDGFRAISQPLLEGLAVYFFWNGRRRHSMLSYLAAGASLGGVVYTYLGGRTFPAVLVAFGIWSLLFEGWPTGPVRRRLLALAAAAVVVAAPIYIYWLTNPGTYMARMSQVFVLNPAVNKGQPLVYLADNLSKMLQVFTMRGESMWRYNLPDRPIFEWALVPAFYIGLIVAFRGLFRRDAASTLLLLWLAAMLLPSVLSWDTGGYTMRNLGLLPALHLLPALGIVAAWDWLARRWPTLNALPLVAPVAALLIVASDAGLTYRDYFVDWSHQFGVLYETGTHDVAQARYIAASADPSREDVFAGSDYRGHPVIAQLAPQVYKQLRWFDGSKAVVYSPTLTRDSLYVLSFSNTPSPVDRYFPADTLVSTQPFESGVIPDQPGPPMYSAFRLTPAQVQAQVSRWLDDPASRPFAVNFDDQLELLAAQVLPRVAQGEPLSVTVVWRVLRAPGDRDYMFFSHLNDAKGAMWAQQDKIGYPPAEWRPGDIVVARHDIAVPENLAPGQYFVEFGLYNRQDLRRVPIVAAAPGQTTVSLASVKVVPAMPLAASLVKNTLDNEVGDRFKLLGYNLDRGQSADKRLALDVTLLWSALTKPPEDYTVFVQLLDPAGKLAAQSDAMPGGNRFPTTIWDPDELVADTHRLTLDANPPPGSYQLIAGMYLLSTGKRLPVAGGGDYVQLGEVSLP